MRTKACVLGLLLVLCAAGCAESEPETLFKGQTYSLQRCLAMLENTIKRETGQARPYTMWDIFDDKPDDVSGWVWGDYVGGFSCELQKTGTRGTYWEGWVFVPDRLRTKR